MSLPDNRRGSLPVFSNCPDTDTWPPKGAGENFNGFELFGGRFLDFIKGRVFNCFLFFFGFWGVFVCVCVWVFLIFNLLKLIFMWWLFRLREIQLLVFLGFFIQIFKIVCLWNYSTFFLFGFSFSFLAQSAQGRCPSLLELESGGNTIKFSCKLLKSSLPLVIVISSIVLGVRRTGSGDLTKVPSGWLLPSFSNLIFHQFVKDTDENHPLSIF